MGQGMGAQNFRVVPGPALVARQGGQPQKHSEGNRDDPDTGSARRRDEIRQSQQKPAAATMTEPSMDM